MLCSKIPPLLSISALDLTHCLKSMEVKYPKKMAIINLLLWVEWWGWDGRNWNHRNTREKQKLNKVTKVDKKHNSEKFAFILVRYWNHLIKFWFLLFVQFYASPRFHWSWLWFFLHLLSIFASGSLATY